MMTLTWQKHSNENTNSIWSRGDVMTNIFVVGALWESHLGVLHKGATYEGSGMPDTRRDLFSLSTRTGPLAATVRENINSIRASVLVIANVPMFYSNLLACHFPSVQCTIYSSFLSSRLRFVLFYMAYYANI